MVREQDTWLQTCLGRFGQKKMKTASRGSRPVREDVGTSEGLICVWRVLWHQAGTQ